MKHLIMGTAGHVDHGKTALIRALTGIDCDTHPEEKQRGITINPGFAFIDLPAADAAQTQRVGIVDVPGHQRFIHNMLAGAAGVDFALLVVAADDGVMPQTVEHLAILDQLGVRDGLVALSKIDLVDRELVEMAAAEIRQAIGKSFLKDAEILPVSATTSAGIDQLKAAIARVATRLPDRQAGTTFRLYMDRVFSVAGFGTVATGSVMGGRVRTGDTLYVLPTGGTVRVRRIQRHGSEEEEAVSGERASLNIVGFKREEFERGMLLADRPLPTASHIDAEINLIESRVEIGLYSKALFYAGTFESACRIHLLDRDRARGGETCLAQIELEKPAALMVDDRFIIRSCSADRTLGGGRVVDPSPLTHRKRPAKLVKQVRRRAGGDIAERVSAEVEKHIVVVGIDKVAEALGHPVEEIERAIEGNALDSGVIALTTSAGRALLSAETEGRLWKRIRRALVEHHHDHPLSEKGLDAGALAARIGIANSENALAYTECLLSRMAASGKIARAGGGYRLAGFKPNATAQQQAALDHMTRRFSEAGMSIVSLSELESEIEQRFKLGTKDLKILLAHLVQSEKIVRIEDASLWKETVDRCRQELLAYLSKHPEGITVAGFRDLVNGNRRICLLLIGLYDREGTTRREGDLRFLGVKA